MGSALTPGSARAEDDPPAVDIADLPPFPTVEAADEKVVPVTVEGAWRAEEYVVVGASKREQSLGSVASAVTVITADRLRRFGYRTLAEALRGVVGLYITDDRMVERLGIRGLQLLGDSNTRILLLIDGSTINEPWGQFVDTSYALPVHLDDVRRIEVIRGPVSSIYGTNAFLGIINIVTMEADMAPRAYGRVGVDSFSTLSGNAAFSTGGVNRQVRGFASWTGRGGETLDYPAFEENEGSPTTTDADATRALHGAVIVHYERLFFQVRASRRSRELPGAPYDSVPADPGNRNIDRHLLSELGYTREITDRLTFATRAYANHYWFRNQLDLELDAIHSTDSRKFETNATALWGGGEVRSIYEAIDNGKLDLISGVAAEIVHTKSDASLVSDESTEVRSHDDFDIAGVYAEASSAPLPWLGVTAGLRYDRNSEFKNRLSPRGSLFLRKGDSYGLKLLYAEGFRNPSIFEQYYSDGQRYERIEQRLRPESIRSIEAVIWARPRVGMDVRLSTWQWNLADIIEKRNVRLDENTQRFQFQNLTEVASRGAELETSYRDASGWLGFASATYSSVERNRVDAPLNAPKLTANLGVSTPRLQNLLHLSAEGSYIHARHTLDPSTDADAWLGLNLVAYAPDYRGFDITVGVRNLLGTREQIPAQEEYDRYYWQSGGPRKIEVPVVPGPGREIFARVGYQY